MTSDYVETMLSFEETDMRAFFLIWLAPLVLSGMALALLAWGFW